MLIPSPPLPSENQADGAAQRGAKGTLSIIIISDTSSVVHDFILIISWRAKSTLCARSR